MSDIQVTFNGQYVEVVVSGQFDTDTAVEMWTRVQQTCKQHRCLDVLGVAKTDLKVSRLDVANQSKLFDKLGITHKHRIAWVENDASAFNIAYNIETVLLNRGFQARLFEHAVDARDWLLRQNQARA